MRPQSFSQCARRSAPAARSAPSCRTARAGRGPGPCGRRSRRVDQQDRAVEADGEHVLVLGQGEVCRPVVEPWPVAPDACEDARARPQAAAAPGSSRGARPRTSRRCACSRTSCATSRSNPPGERRSLAPGRAQVTSTNTRPEGAQGLAVDQVTEAVAALDIGENTALNQHLSGVCRFLARGEGRDRRRRGESRLEAADLVLLDEPHVVAPGGVLGDRPLRLGRILGPGAGVWRAPPSPKHQSVMTCGGARDRSVEAWFRREQPWCPLIHFERANPSEAMSRMVPICSVVIP